MQKQADDIGRPDKDAAAGTGTGSQAEENSLDADVADVPDPDEDDLDDLDDMLDEFSAVKLDAKKPEVPSGPGRPGTLLEESSTVEETFSEEEFAKQLQAGMADLLGDVENSPELQAEFDSIFKELGAAATADPRPKSEAATSPVAGAAGGANTGESFQETIRRTMQRMQASGEQATAAASAEGSQDLLAELMKQMQAGGLDGEGSEEEFSKMLLGMMEQLTNKEILYEPMKELNDKFPGWLEKNKDKTRAEDLIRYQEQQGLVKDMVTKFEEPTYSDSHAADREYIVDKMQKMQAAGSPPADLVGDVPSAQEALNAPDESCTPQ